MPVTEYLERNARLYPDEVALVELNPDEPDTRRTSWKEFELIQPSRFEPYRREITWSVFDEKANRFANMLIGRGILLTFQHRAGVSSYTSSFDLAQTCVFGKQLLGPILCGSISGAPLLPKLRGQFAEFLNNPSPVGLRIFFLPTCVGLRYGHRRNTHSFSRHLPSRTSVLTSLDRYRNQHPAPRLQMCPCA